MMNDFRVSSLVLVAAMLVVGCGEPTTTPSPDGGTGGSGGEAGTGGSAAVGGEGGTGGVIDLCANVDCDDENQCTSDGTCDPSSGSCEGGGNEPIDTACDQDGGRVCDGEANCVECNASRQCPDDGNECTALICSDGACQTVDASGPCDFMGTAGICANGVCIDADRCDPYPCQDLGPCLADQCNPATGQCSYTNEPDGTVCQENGYFGECVSGQCDFCAAVSCADGNECTIDGICNPSTGICGAPTYLPANSPCSQSGGSVCDGDGSCVECNTASQCGDDNDCTTDACSATHQCTHRAVPNGSICTGISNICIDGACQNDTLGQLVLSGDRGDLYWAGAYAGIYDVWSGFQPWGLAGFYLNFTGSGVDREVERMTASWLGTNTTTILYVRLEDDEGDDGMTWRIDAQQLPHGSERYYYEACNTGTGATTVLRSLPSDKVPVLLGFDLDRSREDKVEEVRVQLYESLNGGSLVLSHGFYDATAVSSPGPYCARVDYALIPKNRVLGQPTYADPTARTGTYTRALAGATRPILQGFRLEFTNGDHNIDQVGIRMLPGEVTVWLNDKNDDDPFRWQIWWAELQ